MKKLLLTCALVALVAAGLTLWRVAPLQAAPEPRIALGFPFTLQSILATTPAPPRSAPGPQRANPKYVAIVIGNSAYAPPNALPNPRNDATDMAAALERLGYTLVRDEAKGKAAWLDVGYAGLDAALRSFAKRAADAQVALVFYAGHGIEEDGVNYLIPVDAKLDRDVDLALEAYRFDNVTRLLPRHGISVVIIDACRTPRFKLADQKGRSRALEGQRGFQVVEAPDRALFAFSAGPNQRASDGAPGDRNSPYTKELVRAMEEPGVAIEGVFKIVRQKFIERGAEQKPEFRDNLGTPNLAFAPPLALPAPGAAFRDCAQCPVMVVVPKGQFAMGAPKNEAGSADNERPQHTVTIARNLAVGKFEITNAEYDLCVADRGCTPTSKGEGVTPVINVNWDSAKDYVRWLNGKLGRSRGKYRLLSEAEWEYAARAGTHTPYPWGQDASHERANYGGEKCVDNLCGHVEGRDKWGNQPAPVGQFPANQFGLFDMHGNVWEWVEDCWIGDYVAAPTDGSARQESGYCQARVMRGGGWNHGAAFVRSAVRWSSPEIEKSGDGGFRIARDE